MNVSIPAVVNSPGGMDAHTNRMKMHVKNSVTHPHRHPNGTVSCGSLTIDVSNVSDSMPAKPHVAYPSDPIHPVIPPTHQYDGSWVLAGNGGVHNTWV